MSERFSAQHWLLFDRQQRNITGCGCGFMADVEQDSGYGDSVIGHVVEVLLASHDARLATVEALLRAVIAYDDANQSDLPLTLLTEIRLAVGAPA